MNGLVSINNLNMSHNSFSGEFSVKNQTKLKFIGNLPDISQKQKIIRIDLSDNQISGSLSAISGLSRLQVDRISPNLHRKILVVSKSTQIFNVSGNQMTGSTPSVNGLSELSVFDVSKNSFSDNLFTGNFSSVGALQCDMTGNNFLCPVTWQSYYLCGARHDISS
jgi:Leucine-rich repeat (LRR) protein